MAVDSGQEYCETLPRGSSRFAYCLLAVYTRRMETNAAVTAFWQAYCDSCAITGKSVPESYDAWAFGDNPKMADELGALVLSGVKTATAGLIWEDEHFGWKRPEVGDTTIILDGEGSPLCIIETTVAVVKPFADVDVAFAVLEGEGFQSVDDWRRAHWRYFSRRCQEIGKAPSEDMPVLCQQFTVVYRR